MTGEAMEAAARAVLHRRIKPDFFEVKEGAWTIDHDKVIAEAAVTAYLAALPDAPAEMPGVEEIARAIYEAQGFAYEGKTVLADGTPYAAWAKAVSGARAILALFAPILAEKERDIERLYYHRQHWRGRADYWEARALAQIAAPGAAMEE